MDRQNFYYGQYVSKDHLNPLQDSIENTDSRMVKEWLGKAIASGFNVTIAGDIATISAGSGWDGVGRSVHSSVDLNIDLSTIERPPAGQYRWLTLIVKFLRYEHGIEYDLNNQPVTYWHDESAEAGYILGASGNPGSITKPSEGDDIIVCDILLDSTSPITNDDVNIDRVHRLLPLIDIKEKEMLVTVDYNILGTLTVNFADFNLPDDNYSIVTQIMGTNTLFIRHVSMNIMQSNFTLYLYHDTENSKTPILGAPYIKPGPRKVGEFKIGERDTIQINVFIKKEAA